jgi:hypothetical protein
LSGQASFLDFLREGAGEGRPNDELVRAVVPLFEQVIAHHDEGRVAPLSGVGSIHAGAGHLWFRDADAKQPVVDLRAIRAIDAKPRTSGIDVVDRTSLVVDLDTRARAAASKLVARAGDPIEHPVYLPDYVSWEDAVGHHDALTDVFALGMITASLATGADFTDPAELERFVVYRHHLTSLAPNLHPVIAKAIVRMTELGRSARAQDLSGLKERLVHYREVDERADEDLDFRKLKGFVQADTSSRRTMIQSHLQSRLFDMSRRNRLIYFKPTLSTLDLTEASVPTQLAVDRIRPEDLLLWTEPVTSVLAKEKPLRLDRYVRFEETAYARGVLDQIRAQARRDEAEFGASELRLVIAFLNWHNLREEPDERIRSPLLWLPMKLEKKRGVRDSYEIVATTDIAEINPALRHALHEIYGLDLPERLDLGETDVPTLHEVLAAEIARSEPGITLHLITRPQIRLVHERARRRLMAWKRKSQASGAGIRRFGDVAYSYARTNLRPLGLELFLQKVKPERLGEHFEHAEQGVVPADPAASSDGAVETQRSGYQFTEAAIGRFDWAVDLTHITLGNFNSRNMSLVRDYDEMLAGDGEREHPAFDDLFSLEAREVAAPSRGGDPFEPFVVVPADPTQTAALHWAREGRNFIIQGPPGTGKSQTITNLIADFAARGKRVLFVCEKRAALDVVYHRLAQHGLDELSVLVHDSQTDKKALIAELGATYERWLKSIDAKDERPAESRRAALRKELSEPLDALERFAAAMNAPAEGAAASVASLLRARLAQGPAPSLSAEERERIPAHRSWSAASEHVGALARALTEIGERGPLSALPLLWLGRSVLESERPLATLRERLDEVESHLAAVDRSRELVGAGATASDLREALALANDVAELADRGELALLDPESKRSRWLERMLAERTQRAKALARARESTRGWREKLDRADLAPALALARRFDALFVLFLFFMPAWWRLRAILRSRYDFAKHTVAPTWLAILGELSTEYEREDQLATLDELIRGELGIDDVDRFVARLAGLRSPKGRTPLQISLRSAWSRGEGEAVRALQAAGARIDALSSSVNRLFDGAENVSIESLPERLAAIRKAADLLPELKNALLALSTADRAVRDAVRTLPLTAAEHDAAVAQEAIDRTLRANRPLAHFDHSSLARRLAQLRDGYDGWLEANAEAVRENVRSRFLERARLANAQAASLSAEQKELKRAYNAGRRVLEHELGKVMRHKSIRELSSGDAGTVLYDLKPIWLMSPLSISDILPLSEQRFDVVIFDEASQIPLEEAVPALYRAPQMIVVGDEMQLPPTTFFAAKREDELDFEDAAYDLDADSFLTHAVRRLPSTMLGWHYRSRSESLIRFSNHAFYGGKLLTVPDRDLAATLPAIDVRDPAEGDANAARVLDRPVSFHRLAHGVYTDRRNSAEAAYIARLVRGLLAGEHRLSLGIVAFSEAQQGEIERALEALADEDGAFGKALDAEYERTEDGQIMGLFVKNLENVQGDERDVIVLSICYGPDADGRMKMNFGPINKGGGEKRLNVVFSRAKRHMAVVSSIDHTAITNEYNEGSRCFRRYLQYARALSTGDVEGAGSVTHALTRSTTEAPEIDPIAEDVAAALAEKGYRVVRNAGTSEFRVDVALARPADDRLVLAILIDSSRHYALPDPIERYHSRPAILRAFGWEVEWVLAKDWLEDRNGCLARIESAYRAIGAKSEPAGTPASTEADASPAS